jgi:hypothetical protein
MASGAQWTDFFAPWLAEQYTAEDRPDSWYALKYVLAEAFQALELGRMLFRIDETPGGDMMSYYAISADGAAALKRGDVAEVLERASRPKGGFRLTEVVPGFVEL